MTIRKQLLLTPTRESPQVVMKIQHSQKKKINKIIKKMLECNSWVIQQLHVQFYRKLTNYFSKMAVLFYFISPPMIYEIPLIIFMFLLFIHSHFKFSILVQFSSVAQLCLTLQPQGLQHTRLPCLSTTPRAYSNSCPLSRSCHPTISFSVVPFSSCPQSLPASGSFPMSQLFA